MSYSLEFVGNGPVAQKNRPFALQSSELKPPKSQSQIRGKRFSRTTPPPEESISRCELRYEKEGERGGGGELLESFHH